MKLSSCLVPEFYRKMKILISKILSIIKFLFFVGTNRHDLP